jgi:hypothetical protein
VSPDAEIADQWRRRATKAEAEAQKWQEAHSLSEQQRDLVEEDLAAVQDVMCGFAWDIGATSLGACVFCGFEAELYSPEMRAHMVTCTRSPMAGALQALTAERDAARAQVVRLEAQFAEGVKQLDALLELPPSAVGPQAPPVAFVVAGDTRCPSVSLGYRCDLMAGHAGAHRSGA